MAWEPWKPTNFGDQRFSDNNLQFRFDDKGKCQLKWKYDLNNDKDVGAITLINQAIAGNEAASAGEIRYSGSGHKEEFCQKLNENNVLLSPFVPAEVVGLFNDEKAIVDNSLNEVDKKWEEITKGLDEVLFEKKKEAQQNRVEGELSNYLKKYSNLAPVDWTFTGLTTQVNLIFDVDVKNN